jgi:hypothetical protein
MPSRQPGGICHVNITGYHYWCYSCRRGHARLQHYFPYTEEGHREALAFAAQHRATAHGEENIVVDDIQIAIAGVMARMAQDEEDISTLVQTSRTRQAETRRLLDELKKAVADQFPPFRVGQTVRVRSKGGAFIVDAIERAFGMWIVLGHFPTSPQRYTYPSSALE